MSEHFKHTDPNQWQTQPMADLGEFDCPDPSAEAAVESVSNVAKLPDEIVHLLDALDEKEREILRLRFGIDRGEPRSLEEVAEIYDTTRENIRKIEMLAMRKLR